MAQGETSLAQAGLPLSSASDSGGQRPARLDSLLDALSGQVSAACSRIAAFHDEVQRECSAREDNLAHRSAELERLSAALDSQRAGIVAKEYVLEDRATKLADQENAVTSRRSEFEKLEQILRDQSTVLQGREEGVLRRERDVAAEAARLKWQAEELARCDASVAARSVDLEARERTCATTTTLLQQRSEELERREAQQVAATKNLEARERDVATREAALSELATTLHARADTLTQAESRLRQQEAEATRIAERIRVAAAQLEEKQRELVTRDASLAAHDAMLRSREEALVRANKNIEERESDVARRGDSLAVASARLAEDQQRLAALDADLTSGFRSSVHAKRPSRAFYAMLSCMQDAIVAPNAANMDAAISALQKVTRAFFGAGGRGSGSERAGIRRCRGRIRERRVFPLARSRAKPQRPRTKKHRRRPSWPRLLHGQQSPRARCRSRKHHRPSTLRISPKKSSRSSTFGVAWDTAATQCSRPKFAARVGKRIPQLRSAAGSAAELI